MVSFRLSSFVAACTFTCAAQVRFSHASETIYDSSPVPGANSWGVVFAHDAGEMSSTDERAGGFEEHSQWAQYIQFSGTNRRVTGIDAWYARFSRVTGASRDISFDATLRVYAAVPNGDDVLPGALLWEETRLGVVLTVAMGHTPQIRSFDMDVVFPDSAFISISHSNFDFHGGIVQTAFGNYARVGVPSVGTADSGYFEQLTATGEWRRDPNGQGFPIYTAARIVAEPVPAASPLLVVGGGMVAGGLRRRRRVAGPDER